MSVGFLRSSRGFLSDCYQDVSEVIFQDMETVLYP